MKITDPQFAIPEIIAIQYIGTAQSGANRPLFIEGIDKHRGKRGDYVLKYRGAERMTPATSAKELLAAFMANQINIQTPQPALVFVMDNFLETLAHHEDYQNIQKGKGINFGSVKIHPNNSIIYKQRLTFEQQQQALQIFVFDLWIQNADRRFEKPNMFVNEDKIFVIDHELAFSFLDIFSFIPQSPPFLLGDLEINNAKNHFFYPTLQQNKHIDIDAAFLPFNSLNAYFWQRVRQFMPPDWFNALDIGRIEQHSNLILDNCETFKQEIWTKLMV